MAEVPREGVAIRDFRGMASNLDPTDIQPGVAELQVNVNGLKRGELAVRRGIRELTFDTAD